MHWLAFLSVINKQFKKAIRNYEIKNKNKAIIVSVAVVMIIIITLY